jgi:hypothetical protein
VRGGFFDEREVAARVLFRRLGRRLAGERACVERTEKANDGEDAL